MIRKENLKQYCKQLKYNMAQVEKDYLQHLFLLYLSSEIGTEFVFKGGTALQKCLGLKRFSEDLDFTFQGENNNISEIVNNIAQEMNVLYETDVKIPKQHRKTDDSEKFILRIKGPLFIPENNSSLSSLRIDVSLPEQILSDPVFMTITPIYNTVSSYSVNLMSIEEMLAEKIRAILSRDKARDVYDMWFLLKKNVPVNIEFVKQKLAYTQHTYSVSLLLEEIKNKAGIWDKELTSLLIDYPKFQLVFDEIRSLVE